MNLNMYSRIINKYYDFDLLDIIDKMQSEIRLLENKTITEDKLQYISASKEILFFLMNVKYPISISKDEFMLIKPLAEKLVIKKQLNSDVLNLFK